MHHHAPEDNLDRTRQELLQHADSMQMVLANLCNYLELRDDRGVRYSITKLVAYCGAASKAVLQLYDLKDRSPSEVIPLKEELAT